ncbi:MAG: efflux RND transporter periplasmic adaptor subunit [Oscillospiraceae bacterium]|nr:efflux RND transporter periplasmic adaptor subunit [Oscillospiraceae bacterium]
MKRKIALWVTAIILAVAGFLTVPGMVESSIPSIYYVSPTVKTYENIINCTGIVQSENIYNIYASTAFVPGAVNVSLGDLVRKGDPLVTVDSAATGRLIQNAVGGALGGIAEDARSAVASVDIGALVSAFGLSGVLGTDIDLGGISDVLGGEGSTAEARAVPAEPEIGEIRAPADGIVTEISAYVGSPVSAGKTLLTIHDAEHYKVMAVVSESDVAKIQLGDSAVIRGVGFAGSTFQGVVSKIYPVARKALTGTNTDTVVDVEITVTDPNDNLRHGFSAKVEIAGDQSYELITVPYEAIRQDGRNEEYVYTYENGKLKKRPIVTGKELVNVVEVLDGLSPDSVVIFNPDDVTGEGSIVNIKGRAEID